MRAQERDACPVARAHVLPACAVFLSTASLPGSARTESGKLQDASVGNSLLRTMV